MTDERYKEINKLTSDFTESARELGFSVFGYKEGDSMMIEITDEEE